MKKSCLFGAVCAFAFYSFTLSASATTHNVISGTFDVIDQKSGSVGLIPLTGNGVLVEGVVIVAVVFHHRHIKEIATNKEKTR